MKPGEIDSDSVLDDRRPWYRFHSFTRISMFIMATAIVVTNLRGCGWRMGSSIWWTHGWPLPFVKRDGIDYKTLSGLSGEWIFQKANTFEFNVWPLLMNLLVLVFVVACVAFTVETWLRSSSKRSQFGLRSLMIMPIVLALYFTIPRYFAVNRLEFAWRQLEFSQYAIAQFTRDILLTGVVIVGIWSVLFTCIYLLERIFARYRARSD